jgi:hypothetical protein
MYPPKISNEVAVVLRDNGSRLAQELKAARAAGKLIILRGTKRIQGPKKRKNELP